MSCAAFQIEMLAPAERPSVLIVEDNQRILDDLVSRLRGLGITPLVAKRGLEALQLAGEHRPDLLFLDGLLPEMHGFEIARFVRHMDRGYRPHIAILTGVYKHLRYQNEARLKYGIDDYLMKPIDDLSLAAVVRSARKAARVQ